MIIFDADDPLVLNGTYDQEGYKPGERERIAKARAHHQQLEKGRTMALRQQELVEDARIKELEQIAVQYADIRDQRMELNKQEATLKADAMRLMKKHKKQTYLRDGIEITIEPAGEETIKVRVKKPVDDQGEQDEA